jgi:hypothetical protein
VIYIIFNPHGRLIFELWIISQASITNSCGKTGQGMAYARTHSTSHNPFDADFKDEFKDKNPHHSNDSDSSDSPTIPTLNSAPARTYNFHISAAHRYVRLLAEPSKNPVYVAENSFFTPGKPDLTLKASSGSGTGPVLGCVKFRPSPDFKVCIGDPSALGSNDCVFEDVRRQGKQWKHGDYGYTMSPSGGVQDRKTWVWKRVRLGHWMLVDEATGETRATFVNDGIKHWFRTGRFEFAGDGEGDLGAGGMGPGGRWEVMAILVLLGIVEKDRRRNSR